MDDKFDIMSKEQKMLNLKLTNAQKYIKVILHMKDNKDQNHKQPGLDMSITSSRNSESPTHTPKGTQYQSFIMYPPREKIEMMKYKGGEDQ